MKINAHTPELKKETNNIEPISVCKYLMNFHQWYIVY